MTNRHHVGNTSINISYICDFISTEKEIKVDIFGVLVGKPKAAPIQPYLVNMSQIMLMISGDVEPNPGPNPR